MGMWSGKVAVVTGGNRGIGNGIAAALTRAGLSVALTSRRLPDAQAAAAQLGASARGYPCDVRRPESVHALFESVDKDLGGVDVLIANAGVGIFQPVSDMSVAEWDTVIETNLSGLFYCTREALPRMKKRGGGYVFAISSLAGKHAFPGGAAYSASKFGVNGFCEALFQEVRHDGIRVSYLMPGSVATDFGRADAGKQEWALQPEDVGDMVVALLHTNPRALHSRVEMRPARPPKRS